jgi:hypothetical protein
MESHQSVTFPSFDKVPHQRLLYKLEFYGIKNETLNWISAFLSNHTQTVVLDGESSDIAPVTSSKTFICIGYNIVCMLCPF